jgi:hypothetical protein
MITCHRSHLEARCRERGYTLVEVMPCVVSTDGDNWTIDVEHPAYPRVPRRDPRAVGLGEWISRGLAAIGITPSRVSRWLGRECGCKARAAALDRAGFRLLDGWRRLTAPRRDRRHAKEKAREGSPPAV